MKEKVPTDSRIYLLILTALAILTIPLPFIDSENVMVAGIPLWLVWSFAFSILLTLTVIFGLLFLWKEDHG